MFKKNGKQNHFIRKYQEKFSQKKKTFNGKIIVFSLKKQNAP